MDDNKIVKIPVSWSTRWQNRVGKFGVTCMVSERWLSFGERGAGPFRAGEFLNLDVMTMGANEEPRKLCSLVVTREDLLRAIGNIEKPDA